MKDYYRTIAHIVGQIKPASILDAPAGGGWLAAALDYNPRIEGIDLYAGQPQGYTNFFVYDLDQGLPPSLPTYDMAVCCEGIEHLANPGLLLNSLFTHLKPGGTLIVSTPNTWYPAARLTYLLRGFFPSFPCLAGKIHRGTHMHILPWTWPQLYLFLRLSGYEDVALHDVDERKPKHLFEHMIGWPLTNYCRKRGREAATEEEASFWRTAGSAQSLYGRRLVVSARKPAMNRTSIILPIPN